MALEGGHHLLRLIVVNARDFEAVSVSHKLALKIPDLRAFVTELQARIGL